MLPDRIRFIDFARGLSMLTIVVYHAIQPVASGISAQAIQFGGAGVHLFIFLSGFGLTVGQSNHVLSQFYSRRLTRIALPYFLFVTALFVVNQRAPVYPTYGWYAYLGHIFLFKMFDESIIGSFGYHLWFLSTIIQFYLVYPFLVWLVEKLGGRRLLILAFATTYIYLLAIVAVGRGEERVFNSAFVAYLWEFVLGMIAANAYIERRFAFWDLPLSRVVGLTSVNLILMACVTFLLPNVGRHFNDVFALFSFTGFVILAYRVGFERLPVANQVIEFVGKFSYELYLTHGLAITLAFAQFRTVDAISGLTLSLLSTTLALLVGYGYWTLVRRLAAVTTRRFRAAR